MVFHVAVVDVDNNPTPQHSRVASNSLAQLSRWDVQLSICFRMTSPPPKKTNKQTNKNKKTWSRGSLYNFDQQKIFSPIFFTLLFSTSGCFISFQILVFFSTQLWVKQGTMPPNFLVFAYVRSQGRIQDFGQGGPEPKMCSKLPENCMILRNLGGGPPGLDPPVGPQCQLLYWTLSGLCCSIYCRIPLMLYSSGWELLSTAKTRWQSRFVCTSAVILAQSQSTVSRNLVL